ncbi:nitrogen fixation protein FixH [Hydrogenophaga sp. NFH-34]|uniref:nitrogen fixation protein FixH n=1 Tax=Hydrogenophaga sp. NFH-34 TaxID=2744446 RepID=UPI001F42A3D8|nr:nitrogen fixation protein FixH [Hydrogenophaga sp. NFH-34]
MQSPKRLSFWFLDKLKPHHINHMDWVMNSPQKTPPASAPIPWWRVPHMWLVLGGPMAVVVAGIATAVIAYCNQDPVLDKVEYERDLAAAKALQGKERVDALVKMQPAGQARNHAASPVVPGEAPER